MTARRGWLLSSSLFVALPLKEFADHLGDFSRMRLQGEMTGVEKLNLGLG